jgi:hypothetical protein
VNDPVGGWLTAAPAGWSTGGGGGGPGSPGCRWCCPPRTPAAAAAREANLPDPDGVLVVPDGELDGAGPDSEYACAVVAPVRVVPLPKSQRYHVRPDPGRRSPSRAR